MRIPTAIHHLVEVSLVAALWPTSADAVGDLAAKLQAPFAHRFMADFNPIFNDPRRRIDQQG